MNYSMTRTLALAAASTLVLGGNAMAGIVTVVLSEEFIVTNNDVVIALFEPTLTTEPYPTGNFLPNALRLSFRILPFGDLVSASISGNSLPLFPSEPFQTPALVVDRGLDQVNTYIDASRIWDLPAYDASTGDLRPATLNQLGDEGSIDIRAIGDGGSGYIGYASSDLSMFGYMQIERKSLTQWRLVGYVYDDSGAPVLVQNLVPSASSIAVLTLGLARVSGRTRR